jgi:hypothetical protein
MLRHCLPQLRDLPAPLQQRHLRRLDRFFDLAGRGRRRAVLVLLLLLLVLRQLPRKH